MNSGANIRDLPIRTGLNIDDKQQSLVVASNRGPHNMAVAPDAARATVLAWRASRARRAAHLHVRS